jgi:cob(I)alamin adenosyltransferase
METFEIMISVIGFFILVGLGFVVWIISKPKQVEDLGILKKVEKERDEFSGKNKQLWAENESAKNDLKSVREKLFDTEKVISKFQAEEKNKERIFNERLENLENVRKNLDDERARIRREDEEEQKKVLEQKTKIWNEHENLVISRLKEVCQKPEVGFNFFENTNLPPEFDGNFKPDFLVEFLGQYIYFDAKFSDQKDPNGYFSLDRLSKISKKCKVNKVYSTIFFVVPENRVSEIRKFTLRDNEFSFFIISASAIEPILTNFKKITEYENLEKFDPEDREKIVNLLANYDKHISFQNAFNILSAEKMITLMEGKENLPEEFREEIALRKQKLAELKFTPSEIKKLSGSLENQKTEISKIKTPKISLEKKDVQSAQNLIDF